MVYATVYSTMFPSFIFHHNNHDNILTCGMTFLGVRQSKFRHLEGVPLHKSHNIENIRNLSKTLPGESDMFHANTKFCALPLGGSGGLVAVLKVQSYVSLILFHISTRDLLE